MKIVSELRKLIRKIRSMFEPKYDFIGLFREGMAQTRDGDEWFHINQKKKPTYKKRFDWVGPFIKLEGCEPGLLFAPARDGDEYFQIDPKGNLSLGPFEKTGVFFYTIAHGWITWIMWKGKFFFISPDGAIVP